MEDRARAGGGRGLGYRLGAAPDPENVRRRNMKRLVAPVSFGALIAPAFSAVSSEVVGQIG